jgi:hypothetical protein
MHPPIREVSRLQKLRIVVQLNLSSFSLTIQVDGRWRWWSCQQLNPETSCHGFRYVKQVAFINWIRTYDENLRKNLPLKYTFGVIIRGLPATIYPYLSMNHVMDLVTNQCNGPVREVGFRWQRWVFDGRVGGRKIEAHWAGRFSLFLY